jgi:hypothetical protein
MQKLLRFLWICNQINAKRSSGATQQITPITSSTGASDAGQVIAANSQGKLDVSLLPEGLGPDTVSAVAAETLSAGAFVNLFNDDGVFSARLADNSNGREANGFVLAAFDTADEATVYQLGEVNGGRTGLTLGAKYWLGTTGGVIAVPLDEEDEDNVGFLSQYLGKAKSATELVTVEAGVVTL